MNDPFPPATLQDEARLGELAMKFRGTRRDTERRLIARDYRQTVDRLIRGGRWQEMPAPEDQLRITWMPKAFIEYWSHREAAP